MPRCPEGRSQADGPAGKGLQEKRLVGPQRANPSQRRPGRLASLSGRDTQRRVPGGFPSSLLNHPPPHPDTQQGVPPKGIVVQYMHMFSYRVSPVTTAHTAMRPCPQPSHQRLQGDRRGHGWWTSSLFSPVMRTHHEASKLGIVRDRGIARFAWYTTVSAFGQEREPRQQSPGPPAVPPAPAL